MFVKFEKNKQMFVKFEKIRIPTNLTVHRGGSLLPRICAPDLRSKA